LIWFYGGAAVSFLPDCRPTAFRLDLRARLDKILCGEGLQQAAEMKSMFVLMVAFVGLLGLATPRPLPASEFPIAEHTPGFRLTAAGSRSWNNGLFYDARKFREAALYADKVAQFNLGVIHYRGDGIDPDAALAWAWFALAAERDYAHMVQMRDAVWAELDETGRGRAREHFENLAPEYGDAVAVPRTVRVMERQRKEITGSRVGSIGALKVIDRSGKARDGEDYYREEAWDFHQVIAAEKRTFDAWARGTVTARDIELKDDEPLPEPD